MNAISIKNLHKSYPNVTALRGISFDIEDGDFFGFLGPNGAGKTTTINCIIGLANFSLGNITVFGKDVIKNYIRSLSDLAGIDGDFMIKLADCESGFNPDAKGDFRGKIYMAHGLFQWWEKSWKHYNKIYKTDLNRELWTDQVKRSVEVVRDYGSDDWLNCRNFIKTGSWDFLKK